MMKFIPTVIVLASAYMTIQAPDKPVIVDQIKINQSGDKIVVVIATKGDFPMKYQWYLYNKPIQGAVHSSVSMNKFMTKAVKAGALYCSVTNCGGKYQAVGMWKQENKMEVSMELYKNELSSNQSIHLDIRR